MMKKVRENSDQIESLIDTVIFRSRSFIGRPKANKINSLKSIKLEIEKMMREKEKMKKAKRRSNKIKSRFLLIFSLIIIYIL